MKDVLTLGFARRPTPTNAPTCCFTDPERSMIAGHVGRLQMIFAGKHIRRTRRQRIIQHIYQAKETLEDDVTLVYLENYDMALGQLMMAGVDVWLNTPQPPMEASGTSGMKAALNGVPR